MAKFIERAVAGAYLSNLDGTVTFDFQFAPHELQFSDRNKFYTRMKVGQYRPEFVWISGDAKELELNLFIDRTYGAKSRNDLGVAPATLDAFRRPATNPRVLGQEVAPPPTAPETINEQNFKQYASLYSPNPNFPQYANDEQAGVYIDFERLRYFLNLNVKRVNREDLLNGVIQYEDRFIPPPMVYFIYGNLWMRGYLMEAKYTFSAVNKYLVPKRLDSQIKLIIDADGLLNPIKDTGSSASVTKITI